MGMWMLFHRSFESHLTTILGLDAEMAKAVLRRVKPRYRALIAGFPDFEKGDRFQMNLVNAAMVAAIVRELPEKPTVEALTDYYAQSMMTPAMRWFCRRSGQKTFVPEHIEDLRRTEALRAADRNPYSWNMERSRRQRLRGPLHQVRHLRTDAPRGPLRPDSRPLPPGLHHDGGRRDGGLRPAVHPGLRRPLL